MPSRAPRVCQRRRWYGGEHYCAARVERRLLETFSFHFAFAFMYFPSICFRGEFVASFGSYIVPSTEPAIGMPFNRNSQTSLSGEAWIKFALVTPTDGANESEINQMNAKQNETDFEYQTETELISFLLLSVNPDRKSWIGVFSQLSLLFRVCFPGAPARCSRSVFDERDCESRLDSIRFLSYIKRNDAKILRVP